MINTKDIKDRIEGDFGGKTLEVITIFDNACSKADYLNNSGIIRCVLFLADKNIEKLKKYIEAATSDPRDVMYWAEYIHHEKAEQTTRVRDFNKPFHEA